MMGGVDRKLAQLCQQAHEALSYALAGSADWVLRDLTVASVRPAPDASRLLVVVSIHTAPSQEVSPDADDVLAKLERARGYLRSEVANAIHRKRTPELSFAIASEEVSQ